MVVHLNSPNGRYDDLYLRNYAVLNIKDQLARLPGMGEVGMFGSGDYAMLPDGALRRRKENQVVPFVYAGVAILSPALFAQAPAGEFALTKLFDR
eukprot:gene17376-17206_t